MWLFGCVNDFVATQGARLSETLAAYLADEWPCPSVHWNVAGQVVVGIEHFTALWTGECFLFVGVDFSAR